ncbi:MAG: suhB [Frankiales bacterium]|nr:suhB [Frankiales bacterium]
MPFYCMTWSAARQGGGMDPAALLDLAVRLARDAGALALQMRAGVETLPTKSSPTDVVTAADRAVERLLVDGIRAARPGDGVLGEEGASDDGTTGVRWVVDPIDGTVNYLYGLPSWGVSVGVEVDGSAVAGAVFVPVRGELFTAVRGGGAFLDGRPIRCTSVTSLEQTLVATGFGYRVEQRRLQGAVVAELLTGVRDIRRYGCASLDLCAAAAGRVDAYYELDLNPWDHAAGALVAAEAGLVVTGTEGRPFAAPMAVVAAPSIAGPLVALLERLHAGR